MAHEDPVDQLSEYDAILRHELSVEPSPSFLPRVREQIRHEPVAAPWRLWRFAPLAAAAALALVIGLFMLSRANTTNPTPDPVASAPSPTRAPAPAPPLLYDLPNLEPNREQRAAHSGQRTTDNGQRLAKEPEVIVDVRQQEALFSFMRLANRGQLTEAAFQHTRQPPLHIEEGVTTIGVIPVAVSPLAIGGVLQSDSERK